MLASRFPLRRSLRFLVLAGALIAPAAHAALPKADFVGKNEWLFSSIEFTDASSRAATETSIDLIGRFNRVMTRNGIRMICVLIPLKARIQAEQLPDSVKLDPYLSGNYVRMRQALEAGGVKVIDLNTPFLADPKHGVARPLFFRHDTHWSPAGSMLGAETTRAAIDADPALAATLSGIPETPYSMVWGTTGVTGARGLVDTLPQAQSFATEQVLPFIVTRGKSGGGSLLGDAPAPEVTLMGSSYTDDRYGFPNALRYTLQRDLLPISISAPQGFWSGMETYLSDDAFQTHPPALLIWEIPERSMDAPPDYPYRDVRYQSDNTEWLLRVSALAQRRCEPAAAKAQIVAGGLVTAATDRVSSGKTGSRDFVELQFSPALGKQNYLSLQVATEGSRKVVLEASGEGEETRWIDVAVPGDGALHALRVPLPAHAKGYTKVRLQPGRNKGFSLSDVQVCRQPEDLLR